MNNAAAAAAAGETAYNIALLGDPGVGKTTLLLDFTGEKELESWEPLIPIDWTSKTVKLRNGWAVKLKLWEFSSERGHIMSLKRYLLFSWGICLVFDLSNKSTLEWISDFWIDYLDRLKGLENVHEIGFLYLIGTKSNLEAEREVSRDRAQAVADSLGLRYFEPTSSSVNTLFQCIVEELETNII